MRNYLFLLLLIFEFNAFAQNPTVGVFQYTDDSYEGYTLFSPSRDTYLIDNCGDVINMWSSNYQTGGSIYLLNDGTLLRTNRINSSNIFEGGGIGGAIEKLDWNSNIIWSYSYNSSLFHQHHDIEPLPNGNILILAWELKTSQEAIQNGRNPSLLEDDMLWPEHIVEISPLGTDSAAIVWEWHLWDHLVQDFDSTKFNFGIVSDNPHLVDINYIGPGQNTVNGPADWIHANSIDYNEELDQIIISSRIFSEFWIIDHSTSSIEAATGQGGNSGMGGDLLYRWGNPIAYKQGYSDDRMLYGQHDVQWIKNGLPGQGNILLFNNGRNRPEGNYSTIDELLLPSNGYNYNIDSNMSFSAELIWSYSAIDPFDFYAAHISGCQRLENGNTLICNGPIGTFFEVDNSGNTVWEYMNPVFGNTIINQGESPVNDKLPPGVSSNSVFRCERIDLDFDGISSLDLSSTIPIEGPPYLYPAICSDLSLNLDVAQLKVTQSFDLLGRNSNDQYLSIKIFSDGTVKKYFNIK